MRISMVLHEQMLALAAGNPAREICGLLLGSDGRIDGLVEAANIAADPARHFEIDPRAQIDAAKAMRDGGPAVIGCYHSHPSGVSTPSERDRALATPGSVWLIIAGGEIVAWWRNEANFQHLSLMVG